MFLKEKKGDIWKVVVTPGWNVIDCSKVDKLIFESQEFKHALAAGFVASNLFNYIRFLQEQDFLPNNRFRIETYKMARSDTNWHRKELIDYIPD